MWVEHFCSLCLPFWQLTSWSAMSKSQKNKCALARGADFFKSTRETGENQSCDPWGPAFSSMCHLGWQCCPRARDWEGKVGSNQPHRTCTGDCINGMKSFQCCKNMDFLEEMYSTYLLAFSWASLNWWGNCHWKNVNVQWQPLRVV